MEFEKSSLWREVEAVQAEAKPVFAYWTADIHTPTETLPTLKVLSVDFVENLLEDWSEMVVLRVTMSAGKFAKRVYPNKSKLEITLYKNPIGETSSGSLPDSARESERYVATLFDRGSPILEGNGQNMPSEETLDLTNIETLDFQLVSKPIEQLRMHTVGGTFRGGTPEEFLKGFLKAMSQQIVVDNLEMPTQVEMVTASNSVDREHYPIKHGEKLVDVPYIVQNKLGGVYSTGLGYFLKGKTWYLWPAFDVTRFDKADRTMTIINVPANKMPGGERTYRQSGRNLVVLATGEVKFADDSEQLQLNEGNGLRAPDASQFMKDWVTVEGNKATASRGASNNEFVGELRPNGNNNVQMSPTGATSNSFVLSSMLARRMGSHIEMVWENSNPKLLIPGMPVRILYLDGDEIKTLEGVFALNSSYVETVGPGLLSTRHRTNTRMRLFVKRKLN